jgi:hypothetical protein
MVSLFLIPVHVFAQHAVAVTTCELDLPTNAQLLISVENFLERQGGARNQFIFLSVKETTTAHTDITMDAL